MAPDDIPHKLRCANCSKLAVNALRLPCCEQAICETCAFILSASASLEASCRASPNRFIGHSNLPQSCPVCEHSPLSAADCSPNKSLRTTIRVFLRTAEKKREASRTKESNDTTPITPVDAPKPSLPDVSAPAAETAETAEKTADTSGDVPIEDAAPQSADEPASGHEEDKPV